MHEKRMGWVWAFATLLLAAFTISVAASAQDSRAVVGASTPTTTSTGAETAYRRTGFSIALYSVAAQGVTIDGPDIDGVFKTKTGGGIGLSVGVGITPLLSVYASLDAARQKSAAEAYIGDFGIAQIDLGARLNLAAAGARTVPFVNASIGGRALSAGSDLKDWDDNDIEMTLSGSTLGVGGGLQHYFSPRTALEVGAEYSMGKFDHYKSRDEKLPMEVNGSKGLRVRLGVAWHL